jgi:hypothetical protein
MHQKREHRHKTGLKQRQSVLELKQAVCWAMPDIHVNKQ